MLLIKERFWHDISPIFLDYRNVLEVDGMIVLSLDTLP